MWYMIFKVFSEFWDIPSRYCVSFGITVSQSSTKLSWKFGDIPFISCRTWMPLSRLFFGRPAKTFINQGMYSSEYDINFMSLYNYVITRKSEHGYKISCTIWDIYYDYNSSLNTNISWHLKKPQTVIRKDTERNYSYYT